MPFFSCEICDCKEPAVRGESVCFSCGRHLCATHMLNSHSCLQGQNEGDGYARCLAKEVGDLLLQVDSESLRARATSLRGGISCIIPSLNHDSVTSMMGGMNFHVPIVFEDGITWLCRIRRNNVSSPPVEMQNRILLSEVATLRFLATSTTGIPVPRVHDFAVMSPSNPVGVSYILMDKLNGKPLPSKIPVIHKRHVLKQLVNIFAELEKHPFPAIGSLQAPDNLFIGPIAADQFADVDSEGHLDGLGPFENAVDYRLSSVRRQMGLIARGEVHHANAVDSYLVHCHLLDSASAFARREQDSASLYYLKHMDDKGDHILVDDNFNIMGIIDWERAQTAPKGEAFAAPLFLLDVGRYYDGENELSEGEELFVSILEEQGHRELSAFVRSGRIEHRWASCLGGDANFSDSLQTMFRGFRAAMGEEKQSWDTWRSHALDRYANDEGLKALLRRHVAA